MSSRTGLVDIKSLVNRLQTVRHMMHTNSRAFNKLHSVTFALKHSTLSIFSEVFDALPYNTSLLYGQYKSSYLTQLDLSAAQGRATVLHTWVSMSKQERTGRDIIEVMYYNEYEDHLCRVAMFLLQWDIAPDRRAKNYTEPDDYYMYRGSAESMKHVLKRHEKLCRLSRVFDELIAIEEQKFGYLVPHHVETNRVTASCPSGVVSRATHHAIVFDTGFELTMCKVVCDSNGKPYGDNQISRVVSVSRPLPVIHTPTILSPPNRGAAGVCFFPYPPHAFTLGPSSIFMHMTDDEHDNEHGGGGGPTATNPAVSASTMRLIGEGSVSVTVTQQRVDPPPLVRVVSATYMPSLFKSDCGFEQAFRCLVEKCTELQTSGEDRESCYGGLYRIAVRFFRLPTHGHNDPENKIACATLQRRLLELVCSHQSYVLLEKVLETHADQVKTILETCTSDMACRILSGILKVLTPLDLITVSPNTYNQHRWHSYKNRRMQLGIGLGAIEGLRRIISCLGFTHQTVSLATGHLSHPVKTHLSLTFPQYLNVTSFPVRRVLHSVLYRRCHMGTRRMRENQLPVDVIDLIFSFVYGVDDTASSNAMQYDGESVFTRRYLTTYDRCLTLRELEKKTELRQDKKKVCSSSSSTTTTTEEEADNNNESSVDWFQAWYNPKPTVRSPTIVFFK